MRTVLGIGESDVHRLSESIVTSGNLVNAGQNPLTDKSCGRIQIVGNSGCRSIKK